MFLAIMPEALHRRKATATSRRDSQTRCLETNCN